MYVAHSKQDIILSLELLVGTIQCQYLPWVSQLVSLVTFRSQFNTLELHVLQKADWVSVRSTILRCLCGYRRFNGFLGGCFERI